MPRHAEDPNPDVNDRRSSQRFPLQLAVRYRVIGSQPAPKWSVSESLNISSSGLLFKTPECMLPGQGVEVYVAWPVALNDHVQLKLALKGPVVRSEGHQAAMRFERYEFKTRSGSGSMGEGAGDSACAAAEQPLKLPVA